MGSSQVQKKNTHVSRVDELSVRQDAIHLEGSKLVAAGLYFCHRHVAASGEANKYMPPIVGPSFRATQTRGPGQSRPPEELRMRRLRSVYVFCVSSGVFHMWCGGKNLREKKKPICTHRFPTCAKWVKVRLRS